MFGRRARDKDEKMDAEGAGYCDMDFTGDVCGTLCNRSPVFSEYGNSSNGGYLHNIRLDEPK